MVLITGLKSGLLEQFRITSGVPVPLDYLMGMFVTSLELPGQLVGLCINGWRVLGSSASSDHYK